MKVTFQYLRRPELKGFLAPFVVGIAKKKKAGFLQHSFYVVFYAYPVPTDIIQDVTKRNNLRAIRAT